MNDKRGMAVAQVPSPMANRLISADIASSVTDALVTELMHRSYPAMLRPARPVWRNRQELRRPCLPPARPRFHTGTCEKEHHHGRLRFSCTQQRVTLRRHARPPCGGAYAESGGGQGVLYRHARDASTARCRGRDRAIRLAG